MENSYNIFRLPPNLPDGYLFYYIEERLNEEEEKMLRSLFEDDK